MALPTTGPAATPVKKKKKRAPFNWRRTLIIGAMALAMISFILPDIMQFFAGFGSNRNRTSNPSAMPDHSTTTTTTATPPAGNGALTPPAEPEFVKEGELSFLNATGKPLKKIEVEIADNDLERSLGLMFRKSMDDTQGMLFLFERSEPQGFWMKNTLIPLDILFVDQNRKITTIHESTTPLSEQSLPSAGDAQYVVEVKGGFCKRFGVKVGDTIEWE